MGWGDTKVPQKWGGTPKSQKNGEKNPKTHQKWGGTPKSTINGGEEPQSPL